MKPNPYSLQSKPGALLEASRNPKKRAMVYSNLRQAGAMAKKRKAAAKKVSTMDMAALKKSKTIQKKAKKRVDTNVPKMQGKKLETKERDAKHFKKAKKASSLA